MKISIIIPTYNRPQELKNCIQSILAQTVKPDELIIIDDGELSKLPFEEECKNFGINYIYYKKDIPGLTASRNKGIELASGDIIFFFDDDLVLFSDYIDEILKVYKGDSKGIIGGVGGITEYKSLKLKTIFKKIIEILFLVSGFKEGKVLPSGFSVNLGDGLFPIKKIRTVDFLSGGISSFRRAVFQEFSFDTKTYLGYGFGEDKDFSFRVSQKYKLFINPCAKVLHFHSPIMSLDLQKEIRTYINFTYRFFSAYIKRGWWSWLFFFYAISGYILMKLFTLLLCPDKKHLEIFNGASRGLVDIFEKVVNKITNN